MQRGHDTNFNVDVVSCRFTGFNLDGKYAKHHRIATFTADDQILELIQRHLLAVIVPPLGMITPQVTNVTNQNLKV